jgi:hypothetical protein
MTSRRRTPTPNSPDPLAVTPLPTTTPAPPSGRPAKTAQPTASLATPALPAGEILSQLHYHGHDPVAHLALTEAGATLLLSLLRLPVTPSDNAGQFQVGGPVDLAAGLLRRVPPDTPVAVAWQPPGEPARRIFLATLMTRPDFDDQLAQMEAMAPALLGEESLSQRALAIALAVDPAKISKAKKRRG